MPRGESEHFYDHESPSINPNMLGKEMMNRVQNKLGVILWRGTEDCRFRSFLGWGVDSDQHME